MDENVFVLTAVDATVKLSARWCTERWRQTLSTLVTLSTTTSEDSCRFFTAVYTLGALFGKDVSYRRETPMLTSS